MRRGPFFSYRRRHYCTPQIVAEYILVDLGCQSQKSTRSVTEDKLFFSIVTGSLSRFSQTTSPPLGQTTCPVRKDASSPARNAMAAAASPGVPTRPRGVSSARAARSDRVR